jgi:hypothetical protein
LAASATAEKAVKARMAEEATAAKAAEEAVTVKAVADEAMAANEAVGKTTTDKVVVKTADHGAAGAKAAMDSAGSGSGSSPTSATGTKRVGSESSSTPPSKRFRCTWKP